MVSLSIVEFSFFPIMLFVRALVAIIRSQYVRVTPKYATQNTHVVNEDIPGLNLLIVGQVLCLLLELDLCLLITIFLIMSSRCFVIVNTPLLISQRPKAICCVCHDERVMVADVSEAKVWSPFCATARAQHSNIATS